MAHGQGSLTEDKRTGNWRARYYGSDGRQHTKVFGKHEKTKARNFLAEQLALRNRGTWIDPRGAATPFHEWAVETVASNHKLAPATANQYRCLLDKHIMPREKGRPSFYGVAIGRIGALDVRRWINHLVNDRKLSPRSVHACYRLFGNIMAKAVEAKLIADAPIGRGVVDLPRLEKKRERVITPSEVAYLASLFSENYKPLILAAAYTGCRWQELAGLKREYLDLDKKVLEVRGVQVRQPGGVQWKSAGKTHAAIRSVPLPPALVEILREHLKRFPDHEFVFHTEEGHILTPSNFNNLWRSKIEGTKIAPFTFHDLRHTNVSWLIQKNVAPLVISRLIGHKDITTTMNVYGHLFPGHGDGVVTHLEAMWAEGAADEASNVIPLRGVGGGA